MKVATWWCLTHESIEMPMEGVCQLGWANNESTCRWKAVWLSGRRLT